MSNDNIQRQAFANINKLLQIEEYPISTQYHPIDPSNYTNAYELFLDSYSDGLIVRKIDLLLLNRGKAKRIVAANITRRELASITKTKLQSISSYKFAIDPSIAIRIERELAQFISEREEVSAPYFGALRQAAPIPERASFSSIMRATRLEASESISDPIYDYSPPNPLIKTPRHISIIVAEELKLNFKSNHQQEYAVVFHYRIKESITEDDIKLINCWRPGQSPLDLSVINDTSAPEYRSVSRLVNARLAEKSAITFLNSCGMIAEDISATQLDRTNDGWKTHDISAGRPIDVKNTTIYRDHTRQTFVDKLKRFGNSDVTIAGVVTKSFPYYQRSYSKSRRDNSQAVSHARPELFQVYLGEFTAQELIASKNAVNLLPGREVHIDLQIDEKCYPLWAFELPEASPKFTALYSAARTFAAMPWSILSTGLAAGHIKEEPLLLNLNKFQRKIVERYASAIFSGGYSKRTICLFIISEFLNAAIRGEDPTGTVRFARKLLEIENFTAREYYDRETKEFNPRGWISRFDPVLAYHGSISGGLYDPLHSVAKLLDLLEACGIAIGKSDYIFVGFNAPNPHVLIGKTREGRNVTIYAYCGGKLSSGGDCNAFPLSISSHKNCDGCGKLICNECGYCSNGCPSKVS